MLFHPIFSYVGNENNPIRLEIEQVAKKARLRFIVNTVLDAEHKIVKVFCGDPVTAHRAGVAFARDIWVAPIPDFADIVIASSYPADIDFWQAEKTLHFMKCAVKRGGDMILLTPCLEGISKDKHHRDMFLKYAGCPSRDSYAKAKADGDWDLAGINAAVHIAVNRELANITIVSDGLSSDKCSAMGLGHCCNLNDAVGAALRKNAPDAKILVLTQGPKVIPVVKGAMPQ